MTLVSSAHRNDLDVWAYLNDVLKQLLAGKTDYAPLLPWNWAADHPASIREFRQEERRERDVRKAIETRKAPRDESTSGSTSTPPLVNTNTPTVLLGAYISDAKSQMRNLRHSTILGNPGRNLRGRNLRGRNLRHSTILGNPGGLANLSRPATGGPIVDRLGIHGEMGSVLVTGYDEMWGQVVGTFAEVGR